MLESFEPILAIWNTTSQGWVDIRADDMDGTIWRLAFCIYNGAVALDKWVPAIVEERIKHYLFEHQPDGIAVPDNLNY